MTMAFDDEQARTRLRLDLALVERGLVATRSRARDLVLRGLVEVDGQVVLRPAQSVDAGAIIGIAPDAARYVSRSAAKLAAALDRFDLSPEGLIALDVGSSTGGFTEVLLERGAAKVYAVDVGREQLHPRLRADARVVVHEAQDARGLDQRLIPEAVDVLVADVSFISLTKALPVPLSLTRPGAWLAALIKPQFEVGRASIGSGGIVRDASAQAAAVASVSAWLAAQPGWTVIGTMPAPLPGGDGNQEYLIAGRRHGG